MVLSSGDLSLQRDDPLIVNTEQGLEWATCLLPPEPCTDEEKLSPDLKVVRKATTPDHHALEALESEERLAWQVCLKRIEKRNLPMRLVDAEYTFDKHKITFYFTAENRVDFRELVRDLARELHSRIELRHIQVRDRSKLVGGLGCCGRELCCASWLEHFVPISMRMAKCQNLSLNPGKISGQCGRLLCCLQYENEVYESGDIQACQAEAVSEKTDTDAEKVFEEEEERSRIVVAAPEQHWEEHTVSSSSAPKQSDKKKGKGSGRRKRRKKSGKKRQ
ncbi:MAG: stage 0 sporulation family protein [Candidatus Hydrogenedens sp.]|nr:stage 0 sporulation family protein [Candidatus Hydrogenedens sp.]